MKIWTDEMVKFVKKNVKGIGNQELADLINAEFETNFSASQVSSMKSYRKLSSGLTGHYQKGEIPWNKGRPFQARGRSVETQFKKGHVPQNHKPVGSERTDKKNGYIIVKTKEPNEWELKHRIAYEEHFGKIQEGHNIIFADGDIYNFDPENLIAVSNAELLIMNRQKLHKGDLELTKTGALVARLIDKTREKQKGKK